MHWYCKPVFLKRGWERRRENFEKQSQLPCHFELQATRTLQNLAKRRPPKMKNWAKHQFKKLRRVPIANVRGGLHIVLHISFNPKYLFSVPLCRRRNRPNMPRSHILRGRTMISQGSLTSNRARLTIRYCCLQRVLKTRRHFFSLIWQTFEVIQYWVLTRCEEMDWQTFKVIQYWVLTKCEEMRLETMSFV